jgi:hypothetical protein
MKLLHHLFVEHDAMKKAFDIFAFVAFTLAVASYSPARAHAPGGSVAAVGHGVAGGGYHPYARTRTYGSGTLHFRGRRIPINVN